MTLTTYEILQLTRKRKAVRQEEIARHLGVSISQFSNWENGRRTSEEMMQKWAAYLGLDMAKIQDTEESKAA